MAEHGRRSYPEASDRSDDINTADSRGDTFWLGNGKKTKSGTTNPTAGYYGPRGQVIM
jgi:hypothetical protein